jgi:hypothetical protein
MNFLIAGAEILIGFWILVIPVVGWILGPILILIGIISFIAAFFPDNDSGTTIIEHHKESTGEELTKLSQLHKDGVLSDEEFEIQKKKLLSN